MIDGTGCERLKKSSRWMATRYAMIRWGLLCRSIRLAKVAADRNCADIVTKVLTGELFQRHLFRVRFHYRQREHPNALLHCTADTSQRQQRIGGDVPMQWRRADGVMEYVNFGLVRL